MERDVEPLEVAEHPPPQLHEHLLADTAGTSEEEHPAGGLNEHHDAQGADDDHELTCRAARGDRWNTVIDAALDQQRNRKAGNVFDHDNDRQERHRRTERPQQRSQQSASLTAQRQVLVGGSVIVAAVFDTTAPKIGVVVGDLDLADVGGGHRVSASAVANRRALPVSQAASEASTEASCS